MKRAADLERRLRGLRALGEAVSAMKSLSAHHFRESRGAVEPARIYREGVERILARTGGSLGAGDGPAGLVVIGGELGLCGAYNAKIVAAAAEQRSVLAPGPTWCVGHRAASQLARRDVPIRETWAAATSASGLPELLLRLAESLLTAYVAERLSSLHVISSRFGGVGTIEVRAVRLLPIEARPKTDGHVRYVTEDALAAAAVREFLYVELWDLLLDGLASEHGARLVATQSAEKWLDERIEHLRRRLASTRREGSTQEMIEIAAGGRARAVRRRRRV